MSIKIQLQDAIQQIEDAVQDKNALGGYNRNPLKKLLPYTLAPIIKESKVLNDEFERRVNYYSHLAQSPKYQKYIDDLHEQMLEIQKRIDRAKLPTDNRLKRPRCNHADGDNFWIPMPELHDQLSERAEWRFLGEEGMPYGVGDSLTCPWEPVHDQYDTVLGLMQNAFKSGALENNEENYAVYSAFNEKVKGLKEMFEKPFHQLHISDFEHVAHNIASPEWMGDDEKDVAYAKKHLDRVLKDLLLFLEEHGEGEKYKRIRIAGVNIPQLTERQKKDIESMSQKLVQVAEEMNRHREKFAKDFEAMGALYHVRNPLIQNIASLTSAYDKTQLLEITEKVQKAQEELAAQAGSLVRDRELLLSSVRNLDYGLAKAVQQTPFEAIEVGKDEPEIEDETLVTITNTEYEEYQQLKQAAQTEADVLPSIEVDIQNQKVTFAGVTKEYKSTGLPWTMIWRCVEQQPDPYGLASTELFTGKTSAELNRKISDTNKFWKEKTGHRILRQKDGYIRLEALPETA